jgi:phosphatidylserine decarboxylase
MVRDGIYYALALTAGSGVVFVWIGPIFAIPLYVLVIFCLYFFRDPERPVPAGAVAVSPADGKIVAVKKVSSGVTRISIFMSIFDVHVNRSPISGVITEVQYQPGQFLLASKEEASKINEQNTIRVEGRGTCVVFKQIAGLIARRIVFNKKLGDFVQAGERVGMIKFGSRVDVYLGPEWVIQVCEGERVKAGSSVLAFHCEFGQPVSSATEQATHKKLEPGWAG